MKRQSLRTDAHGRKTPAANWTGEQQAKAFTDTPATFEVTLSNKHDLVFCATAPCAITLGCTTGITAASTTAANRCFPIPTDEWVDVYVPPEFMMREADTPEGSWKLHISVVRTTGTSGTLYVFNRVGNIAQGLDYGGATSTTSTTTTTTTTTTT